MIRGVPTSIDVTGTELTLSYLPSAAVSVTASKQHREGSKAVLGTVIHDTQSLELGWTHQVNPTWLFGLHLKASVSAIRRHNALTISGLGLALSSDENRLRLRLDAALDDRWRLGAASSVKTGEDSRARSNVVYLSRMLTPHLFVAVRYQDTMSTLSTNYSAVTEEYALTLGTRF